MRASAAFVLGLGLGAWLVPPGSQMLGHLLHSRSILPS